MSPRSRGHFSALLLMMVCMSAVTSGCMAGSAAIQPDDDGQAGGWQLPAPSVLSFYRSTVSAVDGDRCPMSPSCSAYAGEAVKKHGILVGWVMTCDRLIRCGRDETRLAPQQVTAEGRRLTLDSVSDNDFWWAGPGLTLTEKGLQP